MLTWRSYSFFLLFALVLCSSLRCDKLDEYDHPVPKPEYWRPLIFVKNLFSCHILPFWARSLFFALIIPDYFNLTVAMRSFLVYSRDLLLIEILDHVLPRYLPQATLFRHGTYFVASVKKYKDLAVWLYADFPGHRAIFQSVKKYICWQAHVRTVSDLSDEEIVADLFFNWYAFVFLCVLPILTSQALKVLLALLFLCIFLYESVLLAFLCFFRDTALMLPCIIDGLLSAAHLYIAMTFPFGRTTLFDPHYANYLDWMILGPFARGVALGDIDTAIPPEKLEKIRAKEQRLKEGKHKEAKARTQIEQHSGQQGQLQPKNNLTQKNAIAGIYLPPRAA
jgi:hypothetical protein